MPSLVLLLTPCTPVGWYVLCKQVSAVSTECIPTCFLTACLLVYAGEREVVQSMSEVARIDRDPVLSQPVHCE